MRCNLRSILLLVVLSLSAFIPLSADAQNQPVRPNISDAEFEKRVEQFQAQVLSEMNNHQPLDSTFTDGVLSVTRPLNSKKVLYLKGIEDCPENKLKNVENRLSYSRNCNMGICEYVSIYDFKDQPIPAEIVVDRFYNGKCIQQKIDNLSLYVLKTYQGHLAMNQGLLDQLGIADTGKEKIEKTDKSLYNMANRTKIKNHNKDAKADVLVDIYLEYGATKPAQDEFMYGGKTIKITYKGEE